LLDSNDTADGTCGGLLDFDGTADSNVKGLLVFVVTKDSIDGRSLDLDGITNASLMAVEGNSFSLLR
jgi:hypothetical protein